MFKPHTYSQKRICVFTYSEYLNRNDKTETVVFTNKIKLQI